MEDYNVEAKLEGDKLTITCELKEDGTLTRSGKSLLLATTYGFLHVPGTRINIALDVIKPIQKSRWD